MIRSMSTAVTGLRGHQQKLDTIGNNIANVNTVAYKKSQTRFEDLFNQTIQGATAPLVRGGINPSQVGMGMRVSSITDIHSQGAIMSTDRITDLAIEGAGFFLVTDGIQQYYTRDGSFGRDSNGDLVNANGLRLLGWTGANMLEGAGPLEAMNIPLGERMVARATELLRFSGNLDARGGWDTDVTATTGAVTVGANFLSGTAESEFQYELTYTAQVAATFNIANFNATGNGLDITYGGLDAGTANITVNFADGAPEAAEWTAPGVLTVTMITGSNYTAAQIEALIHNATEAAAGNRPVEDDLNFTVNWDGVNGADGAFQLGAAETETANLAGGTSAQWDAAVGVAPPFATNVYDPVAGGFGTVDYEGITADLDVLTAAGNGDTITVTATPGNQAVHGYEYYVYDSLGRRYNVDYTFTKVGQNTWNYTVDVTDQQGTAVPLGAPADGQLVFTDAGALNAGASTIPDIRFTPAGAEQLVVSPDFAASTQLAGTNSLIVREQDGFAAGELVAFYISRTGTIIGTYTNGMVEGLGQLAMAFFTNPEGLSKEGGNLFMETANSGDAFIGLPGVEGRGLIQSSALEMSNTDLAYEFTELITTSRAFQANTRVVTTSDEVLVEVINMKR